MKWDKPPLWPVAIPSICGFFSACMPYIFQIPYFIEGSLISPFILLILLSLGLNFSPPEIGNKIELILGPALESMQTLKEKGERFDLIFVDADKENYLNYLKSGLELLSEEGMFAFDNVLWSGSVADNLIQNKDTYAIRMFNEVLCSDKRINLSMLPIGDGLTIAYKI